MAVVAADLRAVALERRAARRGAGRAVEAAARRDDGHTRDGRRVAGHAAAVAIVLADRRAGPGANRAATIDLAAVEVSAGAHGHAARRGVRALRAKAVRVAVAGSSALEHAQAIGPAGVRVSRAAEIRRRRGHAALRRIRARRAVAIWVAGGQTGRPVLQHAQAVDRSGGRVTRAAEIRRRRRHAALRRVRARGTAAVGVADRVAHRALLEHALAVDGAGAQVARAAEVRRRHGHAAQ